MTRKEIRFYILFSISNDMIALRQFKKFWNVSKCFGQVNETKMSSI